MGSHATLPYLREMIIFLIAAGVMVPLFHRFRVSPVLGYLVVGGIIGPFGLGLLADDFPILSQVVISDIAGVQALAELGIVFLLFTIGLELSLERLWAMRRLVFGLGSLQVLVTGAIIGLIAFEFGNSVRASIVLGACLALSSTAIVMQLLLEGRRIGTPLGRSSFAILLMQDLAVVPILFIVGVLGTKLDSGFGADLALALGKAALTIVAIYMIGRLVLRPALRLVAQTRSPEMFMAAVLLTVIGIAAITGYAGLSMALGAFLAGLLLAETEYSHEIEVDLEPFKGLMLGLFFMSVGMGIDWRVIGDEPMWIPLRRKFLPAAWNAGKRPAPIRAAWRPSGIWRAMSFWPGSGGSGAPWPTPCRRNPSPSSRSTRTPGMSPARGPKSCPCSTATPRASTYLIAPISDAAPPSSSPWITPRRRNASSVKSAVPGR